ncbi:MAG: DUF1036 domain-containing protein [Hyphomicrobiaceae bacterium]
MRSCTHGFSCLPLLQLRSSFHHLVIAAGFAAIFMLAAAGQAYAVKRDVTLCNQNAQAIEVASGFDANKGGLTSRGWRAIAACSCRSLFSEDLRATEIFIYVQAKDGNRPLMTGKAPFCTRSKAFRFTKENKSQATCSGAGGQWRMFQRVDVTGTGKQNHKINFRVPGGKPCNL